MRRAFDAPSIDLDRAPDVRATFINMILKAGCCGSADNIRKQVSAMQSELEAYKTALDQHAIVAITDRKGKITHVNEPFCRISRYSREELIGQNHSIVNSGHHPRNFFIGMWGDIVRGKIWRGEVCNKAKNGDLYWVDTTIVPFRDEAEKIGGYVSIRYDITERKQTEASLLEENALRKQAETLLLDIIETIPDGIAAFDRDERLIMFNQAYVDLHKTIADNIRVGIQFEDIMRLSVEKGQFILPEDTDSGASNWSEGRLRAFRKPGRPLVQHLRDGRWLQVRERRSQSGNTVGVRTDITELKRAEITIKNQAEHDPLTGLYNRTVLVSCLQRACARSERGSYSGALVIADLDDFKWVNDTLGHDAGDKLLQAIAARLRSVLRGNDIIVRLGGDEFAFILPRIPGREAFERLMARVVTVISQPVMIGSRRIVPNCSLGVSLFPQHASSPHDLMKNADIALYDAKATHRGGYRIFHPHMRSLVEKREKVAAALRTDLSAGRLSIALQPQVSLVDGRHIGFEALARWKRNGKSISPADFIPIAEETGLILPLGRYVLETALAQAKAMESSGFTFGTLGVNVAAAQLKMDNFVGQVAALLERFAIAPGNLELEVTENVFLDRALDKIDHSLKGLKQLGVKIALDDFGTGYASLTHLKRFPIDRLKIDRSFIGDIETNQDSSAISKAIIGLAHSLGLQVVAEGIETEQQLSFLREHRCDFGQGYLFARPLAGDELREYTSAPCASGQKIASSSPM